MSEYAELKVNDKIIQLPLLVGTEGEKAIDISNLRKETGLTTFDAGFGNTGSCKSAITYLDGEKGQLRYRGIPIEQLAERSTFVETAFLIIYGHLPTKEELDKFSTDFTENSMINEGMKDFFHGYPISVHPMCILSAMIGSMAAFYPEFVDPNPTPEEIDHLIVMLLSKVRTISAWAYKKSIGEPFVYPKNLKYIPNFLNMMFSTPPKPYVIEDVTVQALETLLILHADHEQNCSTSTVRLIGSSWANLFGSISGGINALWGPLHGGANQSVIEMLMMIQNEGGNIEKFVEKAKDPNDKFRLMGFGHRVYKNFDPRAKIIKQKADKLLDKLGIQNPLLDLAKQLEEIALNDDYFIERKLYPNVDFYSGIIYSAIGIPVDMFPVMFAIGRMPGWIAHWREMISDPKNRIGRPRQVYIGEPEREYVPIEKRG